MLLDHTDESLALDLPLPKILGKIKHEKPWNGCVTTYLFILFVLSSPEDMFIDC